jgi:hypothetical protein
VSNVIGLGHRIINGENIPGLLYTSEEFAELMNAFSAHFFKLDKACTDTISSLSNYHPGVISRIQNHVLLIPFSYGLFD